MIATNQKKFVKPMAAAILDLYRDIVVDVWQKKSNPLVINE